MWYDSTDSAARIWHISLIAWDQMDMDMRDALSCGFIDINADIVAIGVKLFIKIGFALINHCPECLLFF